MGQRSPAQQDECTPVPLFLFIIVRTTLFRYRPAATTIDYVTCFTESVYVWLCGRCFGYLRRDVLWCFTKFYSFYLYTLTAFIVGSIVCETGIFVWPARLTDTAFIMVKLFKKRFIRTHGHTVCKFSGKSPLSSHKTTLKPQINGQKRWKMKEKDTLFWPV